MLKIIAPNVRATKVIVKQQPPNCKDCKWYTDTGVCKLFSLKNVEFKSDLILKNTDLCGPDAFYFKQK